MSAAVGIPTTDGRIFLVDDVDVSITVGAPWRSYQDGATRYVKAKIYFGRYDWRTISLHRHILGATAGQLVDHVNGDGLDNRRANIRLCSIQENNAHRLRQKRGLTGFRGVYLNRCLGENQTYRARIFLDGRRRELGIFNDPETAARAYDAACLKANGTFAVLNFPKVGP